MNKMTKMTSNIWKIFMELSSICKSRHDISVLARLGVVAVTNLGTSLELDLTEKTTKKKKMSSSEDSL